MIQGFWLIFVCAAQQSESEDDLLDEGDDDIEEEYPVSTEPAPKEPPQPLVSRETERQLSKKELKKKELAELEAVLAELGISKKETNGQDDALGNFFDRWWVWYILVCCRSCFLPFSNEKLLAMTYLTSMYVFKCLCIILICYIVSILQSYIDTVQINNNLSFLLFETTSVALIMLEFR